MINGNACFAYFNKIWGIPLSIARGSLHAMWKTMPYSNAPSLSSHSGDGAIILLAGFVDPN
jgi:hypothetical protein